MIDFISGHFGSGEWHIKQQDEISFLRHRLPFSPNSEYRIGSNELLDVQVTQNQDEMHLVKLTFTEEREAQAWVPKQELDELISLISQQNPAPEIISSQNAWVKGFIVFCIFLLIFEFVRYL